MDPITAIAAGSVACLIYLFCRGGDTAEHEANHLAVGIANGGAAGNASIKEDERNAGRASVSAPTDAGMAAVYAAGGLADSTFKPGTTDYDECQKHAKKAGITVNQARQMAYKSLSDPAVRRGRDGIAKLLRDKKTIEASETEAAYWQAHGNKPEEKRSKNFVSCLGDDSKKSEPKGWLDRIVYAVLPYDE